MIQVLYPTKDTTIYEKDPKRNTGLDQILEIQKQVTGSTTYNSRILIKFDPNEVSSSYAAAGIDSSVHLSMDVTEAEEIPLNYQLNIHPVSQSWEMGTGKKTHSPAVTVGATWNTHDGYVDWDNEGGDYFTSSVTTVTQSFEYEKANLNANITNIVDEWTGGKEFTNGIPNYGLIIKRPNTQESNNKEFGNINFFSRDTHTIFPPRMYIKWDDSVFNPTIDTGSNKTVIDDFDIKLQTNFEKETYYEDETIKFRLKVQPQTQPKTFYEDFKKKDDMYLPEDSFYAVKDEFTGADIIPFSDYTKISADATSSYFDFEMNNLQPDRFYRFVYKIKMSGSKTVIDDRKNTFRVGI